ncbi:MAG: hypothetical protein RLZZ338_231, partial [Cyanobacteriota bacterium]
YSGYFWVGEIRVNPPLQNCQNQVLFVNILLMAVIRIMGDFFRQYHHYII